MNINMVPRGEKKAIELIPSVESNVNQPNRKECANQRNQNISTINQSSPLISTTVGDQSIPIVWGASTFETRGPILPMCHMAIGDSSIDDGITEHNAIGAYAGSYSIYKALAVASGELDRAHRPNFKNTQPMAKIEPNPRWYNPEKIVSLDPWGHLVQETFGPEYKHDVRPTIAITRANMKVPELEKILVSDGKIVQSDGTISVTKISVDSVWYLPGIASRFHIEEMDLRRTLFTETGGMYPELVTRPDIKVFLPPIGGLTVYVFGCAEEIGKSKLTLRIHDECNGSDVFGSDICTCRPYLIYGIQRCVERAQEPGGVGIVVYFRKEGRALGEVTKFLVYNARKRQEGGDCASTYFSRTENVAGVKDSRFQTLMPDVLHWLGVQTIHEMVSMSNMKYDAIVNSGIKILERTPIPESMLPSDSRVEMEAKVAAGYFSNTPHETDLDKIKGRVWDTTGNQ